MADKFRIDKDGQVVPNPWTNFTGNSIYAAGWSDYSVVAFLPPAVCQSKFGKVYLRGLMNGTTTALSATIFTLPVGLRPALGTRFDVRTAGGSSRLDIGADGQGKIVEVTGGYALWYGFVCLDGVSFDIRA
jgi:hypothetical protein